MVESEENSQVNYSIASYNADKNTTEPDDNIAVVRCLEPNHNHATRQETKYFHI